MNPITKSISEVYFNIPKEILELTFLENKDFKVNSIDEAILNRIVRPRVIFDCNIVGGVEIYISIDKCILLVNYIGDMTEYLVEVPKALTNNRSIISPLSITVNLHNGLGINQFNVNDSIRETVGVMATAAASPPITTSRLELVGENKILVGNPSRIIVNGILKCVVENDANMSNIKPRSYIAFSKLVVLATKAYIYNFLSFKVAKGYIYNGHELSIINDIVNDYASANADYQDYLVNTWGRVAYHNDETRMTNLIAGML